MSPIDDELRSALHRQADHLAPRPDPLAGIEARARSIHRRRVATAAAGTALTVVAVAIAVPVALSGSSTHRQGQLSGGGGGPKVSMAAPTTTAPPTAPATGALGDDLVKPFASWPQRGLANPPELRGYGEPACQFPGRPTGTASRILWSGPVGDQIAILWAMYINRESATPMYVSCVELVAPDGHRSYVASHDVDPKAKQVSAIIPGSTPMVLVVGAPQTGQVMYSTDQKHYVPEPTTDGVALFPREIDPKPGQKVDFIKVLDGNGDLDHPMYVGPIGQGITFPDV